MTAGAASDVDAGLPLRVVLGPCDDMRAEVFVRVPVPPSPSPLRLEGGLAGPECRRSITLPAGAVLIDLGPSGAGLLAKAVLTEPAFWTPELPNLYRLTTQVVADGRTVADASRRIGLRRSGVRGRSLWLEGRRWVPRGVASDVATCDVGVFRDAGAAAFVPDPPEPFLTAADEAGLAVIAVAEGPPFDAGEIIHRIAAWALHPSVVITVLPQALPDAGVVAETVRRLKGTMLVARVATGAAPPTAERGVGGDALIVALDGDGLPHDAWRDAAPSVPLIAWRRGGRNGVPSRPDCDRLQAALAAWGLADGRTTQPWDWAGYLVS